MKTVTKKDKKFLPYGRQQINEDDLRAVAEVLKSDWLTQGPTINQFECEIAEQIGAAEVVACCNGTAALHLSMMALGIGQGDVVITSPITFMASANCARYVGADIVFTDVDPEIGLITPDLLEEALRNIPKGKAKAVIPVHFAGQPVDLPGIFEVADRHGAKIVDDACHAIGASFEVEGAVQRIGGNCYSAMSAFSFHPVKHIAMGEGGAVATNDGLLAEQLRCLRTHGIQRERFLNTEMAVAADGQLNPWYHELQQLGFNYRLSDIHAALGCSQAKKLGANVERRNELASLYRKLLAERFGEDEVAPLGVRLRVVNAYHLFVVRIDFERFGVDRASVMNRLREAGIGTQVHYIPVHLQPYYRQHGGTGPGNFPGAERYYRQALSIPMYPALTEEDCTRVVDELEKSLKGSR